MTLSVEQHGFKYPRWSHINLSFIEVPQGPKRELEPYIGKLRIHFRYPGFPDRVESASEISLGIRDYDTSRRDGPSLLRPNAPNRFKPIKAKVHFPALWPGSYELSCTLAPTRRQEKPLPKVERTSLQVIYPPAIKRQKEHLPLWKSSLVQTVYRPAIDHAIAPGAKDKILFSIEEIGYPLVDISRMVEVPTLNTTLEEAVVRALPLVTIVGTYATTVNEASSIFGPVYSLERGLIPDNTQVTSRKLAFFGKGVLDHATESQEITNEDLLYECGQSIKSELEALEYDPNNYGAYLWLSVAHMHRHEWGLMLAFFLTLYGRLLSTEKALTMSQPKENMSKKVATTAVRKYLPPTVLDLIEVHAKTLGFRERMDFRLPAIRGI